MLSFDLSASTLTPSSGSALRTMSCRPATTVKGSAGGAGGGGTGMGSGAGAGAGVAATTGAGAGACGFGLIAHQAPPAASNRASAPPATSGVFEDEAAVEAVAGAAGAGGNAPGRVSGRSITWVLSKNPSDGGAFGG